MAIDVNGHTQLNGALIAALDAEGKDTGNLSLTTGSFAFNDLTNKSYSSSQSFGVSANLGLSDKANAADPAQSSTESTLNSSTYSYQNQSSTSVDKTLATIGQGNITVGGEAASPEGLNRDADAIHKELYSIDRTQGNIDLTVDHRLLSEDGRKAIVEDAKRTEILGKAIADLTKQSVSLTGSGEGEDSVRDHIGNKQDYFTATKNFTQSPENKEHIAALENPNATPEQKQAAYTALANAIAKQMGVDPTQAKVLMASDPQFAGAYSRDSGTIYVNDAAHDTATAAVTTVGHETQHHLDNQQNPDATQSPQYQRYREEYADIMGNATADYLNFNFAQNNYALAGSNTHSLGVTSADIVRNATLVAGNYVGFNQEDEAAVDYYLHLGQQRTFAQRLDACQGESCLAETINEYRELANQQNGFTPERQQVFDQAAESIYQKLAANCETSACIEFTRNEMLMISTACGSESCIQERGLIVQKAQQIQQEHWGSLAVDVALDGLLVAGALFPAAGAGKAANDALTEINPNVVSDAVSAINQGKLNSQLIADEVTSGHAFTKHVLERKEFADLGIETKEQFFSFIENIVANPAVIRREASDGTMYYLDEATKTIVIRGQRGEATAFRPDQGGIGWENYIKTQVPKN